MRAWPILVVALALSILIGGGIYILLQVAFIGALDPKLLTDAHTWTNLATPGNNEALNATRAKWWYTRAATIMGGSAEVQRGIIADHLLGLPKEKR